MKMSKRNIEIRVRLNRKEAEALNKRVKKCGLSREGYLRHLITGVVSRETPPADYYEQFGELNYKYRNREFLCRGYYVDSRLISTQPYRPSHRDTSQQIEAH